MDDLAKTSTRIGGGIIDLIITFALIMLLAWVTGLGTTTTQGDTSNLHVDGWPFVGFAAIVFVLFAVMEAQLGKTPGKMVVGTRVVDAQGNRAGIGPALIRNLLRFIDGIAIYIVGLIIMIISSKNQRLGDMAARTYVVND